MWHADDNAKAAGFQNGSTEGSDQAAATLKLTFDLIEETLSKQPFIEAEQEEFWPCAEKLR